MIGGGRREGGLGREGGRVKAAEEIGCVVANADEGERQKERSGSIRVNGGKRRKITRGGDEI